MAVRCGLLCLVWAVVLTGLATPATAGLVGDQYYIQAANFPNDYGPSPVTFDGIEELIPGSNGMYVNEQAASYPGSVLPFPPWTAPGELVELTFRKDAAPLYSSLNPSQLVITDLDWGLPGMTQVGRADSSFVYFTSNGVPQTMSDPYGLGLLFLPHPMNPTIQVAVLGHDAIIGTADGLNLPDVFNNRKLGETLLGLGLSPTQINDVHVGLIIDQVPEPTGLLLLGAGLLAVIRRPRRR